MIEDKEKVVIALNVCLNPLGQFPTAAPINYSNVGMAQGITWSRKRSAA